MEKMNIDLIRATNPYLRKNTDIESLKKSIETVGLINPLTINEKNELIAGGRRYQALKELGITEVSVIRVELNELEQELVSIDENLVRTPLNKLELEKCLNRGREIYETLNPTANKVELESKDLTPEEKKIAKEEEENDTTSFAAVTAEKTGLSKAVIKSAIKRDEKSSDIIKSARGNGEISASQVNEIIKLDKEEQEKILPYVKEKSVKEVRKIVDTARKSGLDAAITESENSKELPREFKQLETIVKRANKQLSKIIVENIDADESEIDKIIKQVKKLKSQSSEFLKLYGEDDFDYLPSNNDSSESFESAQH